MDSGEASQGVPRSPVRTILSEASARQAQSVLLQYDDSAISVVDAAGCPAGIVLKRDIDIAVRHGLGDRPAKEWITAQVVSTAPGSKSLHPPSADTLHQTLKDRLLEIWPALMLIAEVAQQKGWELYLVGGAVRDLLLEFVPNFAGGPQALTDIDLVVEGAGSGAGVALAKALQAKYPQVSLQTYGQFQTAALAWPAHSQDADETLLVDIATARTEFYPYPAANPDVKASSIQQDLYRRDFTINAMAVGLTKGANGSSVGALLDFFDGWRDLQQHHVRVLHSNSFIEDPTRIFRAVRFAVRLGFSIEPQTERFIRSALSSGVYARIQASQDKAPALQSRLQAELKYLLETKTWDVALREIERLGAWACLDDELKVTPSLLQQLRRLDRWLVKFGDQKIDDKKTGPTLKLGQPRWLIFLELLLLQLPAQKAIKVASKLNLGTSSLRRLEKIQASEPYLLAQLSQVNRPSQVYFLLSGYALCELLMMGDRHPYTLGPHIWQYIVQLSQVAPPIDGATLKRLGLQPGPQFRKIIAEVHQLALDGELTTAQAAEAYVLTYYAPA